MPSPGTATFLSGGGSGGSVIINTPRVAGSGTVDVGGGLPGGGGGYYYNVRPNTTSSHSKFTGNLTLSGGAAQNALRCDKPTRKLTISAGEDGAAHASTCTAGRESYACTKCVGGYYKGSAGDQACVLCDVGAVSVLGATQCSVCGLGTYSEPPPATACVTCPTGMFANQTGQSECSTCTNQPIYASYYSDGQQTPNCKYKCHDQYAGPWKVEKWKRLRLFDTGASG